MEDLAWDASHLFGFARNDRLGAEQDDSRIIWGGHFVLYPASFAITNEWGVFVSKLVLAYAKTQSLWLIATLVSSSLLIGVQIYRALLTGEIVDVSIRGERAPLLFWMAVFAAVVVCAAALSWLARYSSMTLSARSVGQLKRDLARKTANLPAEHTDTLQFGDMQTRMGQDADAFVGFMTDDFKNLILQPLLAILSAAVIASLNWRLFLVTFAYTPFGMMAAAWLNRKSAARYPERAAHVAEANQQLSQVLAGASIVQVFHLYDWFGSRARRRHSLIFAEDQRINRYVSLLQPVCTSVAFVPRLLGVLYGGWLVMHGQLHPGSVLSILQLLDYAIGPTVYLPFILNNWGRTSAALRRVQDVLSLPEERVNGIQPAFPQGGPDVVFDAVTFSYPGHEAEPALRNVSIRARAGCVTAVVGPSGSGKSTLLSLISGIYTPQSGSIRIGEWDVRSLDLAELRGRMAVVTQRTDLFRGSIADNIALARRDCTPAEIAEAARLAGLQDWIASLPQGYNTILTDGGANLSGGQRQRLSIARSLLRNSSLVLLDEPTSSLPEVYGRMLRTAWSGIPHGATILLVTHRLADAADAATICVIDGGTIIASGSHAQLLGSCPLYRRMWTEQEGQVHLRA